MKDLDRLTQFWDTIIDMIFETRIERIDKYKNYYAEERNYIVKNFQIQNIPEFLVKYRSYDSLITYLISLNNDKDTWQQSARIYINEKFSNFLNYLEFGNTSDYNEASILDNQISIILQTEVFSHVKKLLNDGHYFNAVEEAYKIVREKLRLITGKEKANDAFRKSNYTKIFGHEPKDDAEKDFFEGVKFLHMAIQKLRNEKAHTPAREMDKNLAIHYIVLASLAYSLINRK